MHNHETTSYYLILKKMEREGNSKMWYFINCSQKDHQSSAFHFVQRVVDDLAHDSTCQEETDNFIFKEAEKRFQLAIETPISFSNLIEQLGYNGDSKIAQQLVEARYDILDDLDEATALILEEIG